MKPLFRSAALTTVLMMAVVAFLNAIDAIIVRLLAGEVHAFIIAFFRALFGLICMTPWLIRRVHLTQSPYFWLHIVRGALKLASLIALFIAYQRAALPDATAIVFSLPLFVMLGAWVFLGEDVRGAQLLALAAGMIGMIIIIRPGGGGFDPFLFFALAGAILMAGIQLILKRMAEHDSADRLVAWNLLTMTILGAVLAAAVWETPTLMQFAMLFGQGIFGVANQALVTRAFHLSDASFVGPLDFMRLPAVAILSFLFFGELASAATWIGAGLIGISVVAASWSSSRAHAGKPC